MGLNSRRELTVFCNDLASDKASPGGGTASAAAGAMAASLLEMVLGLSLKSKKRAADWDEIRRLMRRAEVLREEMVRLSEEDAAAYDALADRARAAKESDGSVGGKDYEDALRRAAEVPMRTARACAEVIRLATRTREIGIPSASSDVGVALHLAMAGFRGAAMNVLVNLDSASDFQFVRKTTEDLRTLGERAEGDFLEALRKGERPKPT